MRHLSFLLPFLFLAADNPGGGGGSKPPSLDAQLTAANERLGVFATKEGEWTAERATLTGERDTALSRVTTLEGQVTTVTGERDTALTRISALEGQLATVNGQVTTLTVERDDARRLATNPSAQAQTILAEAGAPAVVTKTNASGNPAATTADVSGLTGLEKAIALRACHELGLR